MRKKLLIIRFSSFGDIVQTATAVEAAVWSNPNLIVHWATRSDFAAFLKNRYPHITVWELNRKNGILGLCQLIWTLKKESFDFVFDAHNNLRSFFIRVCLAFSLTTKITTRSKDRFKRILLFNFRMNLFDRPFRGVKSYWKPLSELLKLPAENLSAFLSATEKRTNKFQKHLVFAPSANWEMKRWPMEYWSTLIECFPEKTIFVLGGPADDYLNSLQEKHPKHVKVLLNLSWSESTDLITNAAAVVSGDTGLLHVADNFAVPTVAIMGPTAFGFPIRTTSIVADVALACRPCTKDGRGRCSQSVYKQCLIDVKPEIVANHLKKFPLSISDGQPQ
jgi:ADP-heptose:LPS heptosyltransferase